VQFSTKKDRFAFLSPPPSEEATYDVHLRLIEKRVVVFLLEVLTELFSLGVTAEALRAIDGKSAFSLQLALFGPKFQLEGRFSPTILLVGKLE